MDPFILARIQFAINITFHIIFPTITMSLAWFLVFCKFYYTFTKDNVWLEIYKKWAKIFAISFAFGVVSGVTMSFQFGTNWPGFMEKVGNIAGPLLGFEIFSAFFIEASFLGIMLFGINKVSNWLHNTATLIVALATNLSGFWIMSLNSWMQSPTGYKIIDGTILPDNWLAIIFNQTMLYAYPHMMLASFITTCFLLLGLSSYQIIIKKNLASAKLVQKIALLTATFLLPLQFILGDLVGINTAKTQPAKLAAIEGLWKTTKGMPTILFAIPDSEQKTNHYEISIPKLGSFLVTGDFNAEIKGLNEFKEHPPVGKVFWSFRIMVGTGLLMFFLVLFGIYELRKHGKISYSGNIIFTFSIFLGLVATIAGWYTTEIGRQPYLIYGLLKTKDAVSSVPPAFLLSSLITYISIYILLFIFYVYSLFFLARK